MYDRYRFNKRDQEPNESLDAYVTVLRTCEQMQLISMVRQNTMAIQSEESSQSKTPLRAESILKEHADVFRHS